MNIQPVQRRSFWVNRHSRLLTTLIWTGSTAANVILTVGLSPRASGWDWFLIVLTLTVTTVLPTLTVYAHHYSRLAGDTSRAWWALAALGAVLLAGHGWYLAGLWAASAPPDAESSEYAAAIALSAPMFMAAAAVMSHLNQQRLAASR